MDWELGAGTYTLARAAWQAPNPLVRTYGSCLSVAQSKYVAPVTFQTHPSRRSNLSPPNWGEFAETGSSIPIY